MERVIPDRSHGVGNGHGGQAATVAERVNSDRSHGIRLGVANYLPGDIYVSGNKILIIRTNAVICYFNSAVFFRQNVVTQPV